MLLYIVDARLPCSALPPSHLGGPVFRLFRSEALNSISFREQCEPEEHHQACRIVQDPCCNSSVCDLKSIDARVCERDVHKLSRRSRTGLAKMVKRVENT